MAAGGGRGASARSGVPPMSDASPQPERLLARPDIRALLLTIIVTGAGQTFYFAILPPLGRELTFSELQIGAVISFASFAYLFMAPVWGRVSDIWGRRNVIVFGLVNYILFTLLIGLTAEAGLSGVFSAATVFIVLIVLRVGFASTAAAMFPAVYAYTADKTTRSTRTQGFALLGAAMGLGTIAGPATAALLGRFSLTLPFYVVVGLVVFVLMLDLRALERTRPPRNTSVGRRFMFRPPARLIPLLAIGATIYTTLSTMQQAVGFRVQDTQGLNAADTATFAGLALMASSVMAVTMQAGLIQWLKWPPRRLLVVGSMSALAGGLVLASTESYPVMVVGIALLGAAFGMMNPAYTAALTLSVDVGEQGGVAGLNGTVQGLGFMIGPLIGGGLYQLWPVLPFLMIGGLAVLSFAIVLFARMPDPAD
jgi:DHA1 family multidrug resistance protein-like MFS transporter